MDASTYNPVRPNTDQRNVSRSWFDIFVSKQTYLNMGYLLLAFPLSLIYFVILVTGIAVGSATLIVWIGVPILLGMMALWWQIATFERLLAIHWLKVPIAPLSRSLKIQMTLRQRVMNQINNGMTWKSLIYLIVKFPFSVLCFSLLMSLIGLFIGIVAIGVVLGIVLGPWIYLGSLFSRRIDHSRFLPNLLRLSLSGFGLGILVLMLVNSLAFLAGQLAKSLLGMDDRALRLAEANALAEEERRKAERAEQSRRQLIVSVSHELRTPIASIRGHAESLMMATDEGTVAPPPDELHKYLNIMLRESERLGSLVDDLLSLARIESDELHLKIEPVNVAEAIEEVYQSLMPLAKRERQVALVQQVEPGLPFVLADRQRLIQVLLNLVRNAITYTQAGGIVSISLQQISWQALEIAVADTGMGIPAAELEHVFERFYRTDASRSRSTGGFGLGLAIVRDLVQAMGGAIQVQSKEGEGSRFVICLPIAFSQQAASQMMAQPRRRI